MGKRVEMGECLKDKKNTVGNEEGDEGKEVRQPKLQCTRAEKVR